METVQNNKLPFLDVLVRRTDYIFQTSVFRKDVFSGLGTSYFSFCCRVFKINCVKTLLHRAYNISSNYFHLDTEFKFLIEFFHKNGYPKILIEQLIGNFLNSKNVPTQPVSQAPKKTIFFPLLYFGHKSVLLKIKLIDLFNEYYPHSPT